MESSPFKGEVGGGWGPRSQLYIDLGFVPPSPPPPPLEGEGAFPDSLIPSLIALFSSSDSRAKALDT